MSYIISVRKGIFITFKASFLQHVWSAPAKHMENVWKQSFFSVQRISCSWKEAQQHCTDSRNRCSKDNCNAKVPAPPVHLTCDVSSSLLSHRDEVWFNACFSSGCSAAPANQITNYQIPWFHGNASVRGWIVPITTFHINHHITNKHHSLLTWDKIRIGNLGSAIVLQCFLNSSSETPTDKLCYYRKWLFVHWPWNKIVLNTGIKKGF